MSPVPAVGPPKLQRAVGVEPERPPLNCTWFSVIKMVVRKTGNKEMTMRNNDREDRFRQPTRNNERVNTILDCLEDGQPEDSYGLDFVHALIDEGEWAHVAHAALLSVPRRDWSGLLNDHSLAVIIPELEQEFGPFADASDWPIAKYPEWIRLAVIMLARCWGFRSRRIGPRPTPTHR